MLIFVYVDYYLEIIHMSRLYNMLNASNITYFTLISIPTKISISQLKPKHMLNGEIKNMVVIRQQKCFCFEKFIFYHLYFSGVLQNCPWIL